MRIIVAPKDEAEYHDWEDISSPADVIRDQCQVYESVKAWCQGMVIMLQV